MFPIKKIRHWFLQHSRDLPWRDDPTPYQVWVSEVMLQQTRVSVVIPYYERWMTAFPTIHDLAKADLADVIKIWEGLGYYSRARNLHAGAQQIVEEFDGQVPSTEEELSTIKGLGPYTIGAIRSFAFHQKAAAVDGNVLRVLARYFAIKEDIGKSKTQKQIRDLAQEILPDYEPWIIAEALIELGATACAKSPSCGKCPLVASCQARAQGLEQTLPIKEKRAKMERLYRLVPLLHYDGHVLLRKCDEGEIMADLHEFPYFDVTQEKPSEPFVAERISTSFNMNSVSINWLPNVKHSFTKYNVTLFPVLVKTDTHQGVDGFQWTPIHTLLSLPFSSGHRRVMQHLLKNHGL